MPRLDVYRLRDGGRMLVVDVQAELLVSLETRMVAPLLPADATTAPIKGLNPVFTIEGTDYVMLTQQMGAIPKRQLLRPLLSLTAEHDTITRALDQLLVGF